MLPFIIAFIYFHLCMKYVNTLPVMGSSTLDQLKGLAIGGLIASTTGLILLTGLWAVYENCKI
jgi:hypothetical protein